MQQGDRKPGRVVSHRSEPAGWLEFVAKRPQPLGRFAGMVPGASPYATTAQKRFNLLSLAKLLACHVIAAWQSQSRIAWPIGSIAPSTQTPAPWRSKCWSPSKRFAAKADIHHPGRHQGTIHTPLTSCGCITGVRYTAYGGMQWCRKVFFQLQAALAYRRNVLAASRFWPKRIGPFNRLSKL